MIVHDPNGNPLEFPDEMSMDQVADVMRKQFPAPDQRFDVLGDTGREASAAWNSGKQALTSAASSTLPSTREARYQQNVANNGPIVGTLKDMFVDTPKELLSAVKVPLTATGILGSPVSGGIGHGLLGSALSYIPGMAGNGPLTDSQRTAIEGNPVGRTLKALGLHVPGSDTGGTAKQNADSLVDSASAFIAPETMQYGLNGGGLLGQKIANAPAAAQADVDAANQAAQAANPAFAKAREAGYAIHPADTGGDSLLGDITSQVGGKIKTQQAASVHNQAVTNAIAAKELGLPPDAPLDEAAFNRVRGLEANAYKNLENSASALPTGRIVADNTFVNDIAGLDSRSADFVRDFPEAAAARNEAVQGVQNQVLKQDFSPKSGIEIVRNLRNDARANLKNWQDADKLRLGLAQRDAANAVEGLMERNLQSAGLGDVVDQYRQARQMIAKSHDVEAATDAAGNVDARKLAALGDKRPLSDGLATIADVAQSFPKSMQLPSKFGGLEKRSILDTLWSTGTLAGGIASGHPGVAAAAALPFVRPLARDAALSDIVQNGLLGLRKQPGNLLPMFKAGTVPLTGAQYSLLGPASRRGLLSDSQP